MKDRLNRYDLVLKDLFQKDRPTLLERLSGGQRIRESLNVELPRIQERRADLAFRLEDASLLHLEFQAANDRDMQFRQGIYGLLLGQKYRSRIRQVVLYAGNPAMRMVDSLDLGEIRVNYTLLDLRQLDSESLLATGRPGDLVLAMLAQGGKERLREIARRAAGLSEHERVRVLTQLVLLAGLRGVSENLKMELSHMGSSTIDIRKNVILREIWEQGEAEGIVKGKAQGVAEGRAEGKAELLLNLLRHKFGTVPKWAAERVRNARPAQLERWSHKILTAASLEGVLGTK
jgi:predicted transposase YdaD